MKLRLLILRFCNFHRWRLVKDADPRGDDESAIMRETLDDEEAGNLLKWFPSVGGQTHWEGDEDAEEESELDGA